MVFSPLLRILLLCLLHFSTRAVGQVDPGILQTIITKFHKNLGLGQYTVVFRVAQDICLYPSESDFPDQNLLDEVRRTIQNNGIYDSDNLIAAKVDLDEDEHSEFRLRDLLGRILNVRNQCVVYFTLNSPCLSRCLSDDPLNIQANLIRLENYEGIKALAFRYFWERDVQALIDRLDVIVPHLPTYLCVRKIPKCDLL